MDAIVRATVVYLFVLVLMRLAGRRTMAALTNFDFVLLLIISEAVQNCMIGDDYSITNGFLVILTLVTLDVLLSLWKQRSHQVERWVDGLPTVLVERGRPLKERLAWARVAEAEVLEAARKLHGLERMDQIKYAVLEAGGHITIIPNPTAQ